MNPFLNGVGATSIQLVGDVLDEVGQPSLLVGSREAEAQPAAGMEITISLGIRRQCRRRTAAFADQRSGESADLKSTLQPQRLC